MIRSEVLSLLVRLHQESPDLHCLQQPFYLHTEDEMLASEIAELQDQIDLFKERLQDLRDCSL